MKEYKTITPEQESELYIWKPNGGFHHKYIFDSKKVVWLELTEDECLQRMKESDERYKNKLKEGYKWVCIDDKMKFIKTT